MTTQSLDWTTARLTTREAERALAQAGLPTDPNEWIGTEMVMACAEVLDQAHARKLERWMTRQEKGNAK